MTLHSFRTASLSLAVAATLACAPAAFAQAGTTSGSMPERSPASTAGQPSTPSQTNSSVDMSQPAGAHQWTEDQILTATVHQAWQLAGRNEQNFFEIVRQLSEISARNRNLTLPDDPAAGKRAGEYIRDQAKADHDQLLYAIVDKAVQMTATKSASNPTTSSSH